MDRSIQWMNYDEPPLAAARAHSKLLSFKLIWRYPIFLLAFGPPAFKPGTLNVDTSQAHFDFWNILQVGLLFVIAIRAIYRLTSAHSITLPRQTKSILRLAFFLALLFLLSVSYSPGIAISFEMLVLFVLTLICVVEFLDDVYKTPPDWFQFLFAIRFIYLLLLLAVLICLPIVPQFVLTGLGGRIRLLGGSVVDMTLVCPVIVIISAYTFLNTLESKTKSTLCFLAGGAGMLAGRVRGAETCVFLVLVALAFQWAKINRRFAEIFIAGTLSFLLVLGLVGAFAGDRIWTAFNRGEDTDSLVTASGRTTVWVGLIEYCVDNPQGMGYIAGIRHAHLGKFGTSTHDALNGVGGTDNGYMEVLADAGWLALFLYLLMLVKTLMLGWHFLRKRFAPKNLRDAATRHALECAFWLFAFCLAEQLEGSGFAVPLRQGYYFLYIVIAIILGTSATLLDSSRSKQTRSDVSPLLATRDL